MKTCSSCGFDGITDEARFCPMCGKPAGLTAEAAAAQQPATPQGMTPVATPGKKSRFSETLWFQDGEDVDEAIIDSEFELPRADLQERYEHADKVDKSRRKDFSLNEDTKP